MSEEIDKSCRTCEDEDTKSCRYPCSECHDLMLDKWTKKIDKSDWKTKNPKIFEYDSKNNIVDIFVKEDPDCPFPFHKDDWWHQGFYLENFIIYINSFFKRVKLPYTVMENQEIENLRISSQPRPLTEADKKRILEGFFEDE